MDNQKRDKANRYDRGNNMKTGDSVFEKQDEQTHTRGKWGQRNKNKDKTSKNLTKPTSPPNKYLKGKKKSIQSTHNIQPDKYSSIHEQIIPKDAQNHDSWIIRKKHNIKEASNTTKT